MNKTIYSIGVWLFVSLAHIAHAGQYNVGMFWTIADKQDPTCLISTSISGWRGNASEVISFSCTDNVGLTAIECRINGGAWTTCTTATTHTVSGLTSGATTTFEVRSRDSVARESAIGAGQTRTWSTDITAPSASLGAISGTNTGSPSIAFSGSDAHSGINRYECSYDTGTASWVTCTSPRAGSTGAAGTTYYFRARSIDNAGNVSTAVTTSWVNGNWSGYGGCSLSCGGGVSTRYCNNPAPSGSPAGMGCAGGATVACNTQPCCVNASMTTNMCAGYVFYPLSTTACSGCPGSWTQDGSTKFLCVDATCPSYSAVTTVSCASGSATVTNDGGCATKPTFAIHTCTCN